MEEPSTMNTAARVPNLICIGMEKSGTTFLNTVFEQSESVLTPTKKEIFYYNLNYHQGLDWYLSWYDFATKPDAPYVCDVTPSYFRKPRLSARVKETSPTAKVLVLLRHPVYRAFSHYIHRLRHVGLNLESYPFSFGDVIDGVIGKPVIFPPYNETLAPWLEDFKREDMLFLSYESDLVDPAIMEQKLGGFLGVEDLDFVRFQGDRINDGRMPKFYYGGDTGKLVKINQREYFIPENTLVFAHAKGTKVWTDIDPMLAQSNLEASEPWTDHLTSDAVKETYEKFYVEDIEKFANTFGIDVSDWLSNAPVSYRAAEPSDQFLLQIKESSSDTDSSPTQAVKDS